MGLLIAVFLTHTAKKRTLTNKYTNLF